MTTSEIPLLLLLFAPHSTLTYETLHRDVAHVQIVMFRENRSYEQSVLFTYDPDSMLFSVDLNHEILRLLSQGFIRFSGNRGASRIQLTEKGKAQADALAQINCGLAEVAKSVVTGACRGDGWESEKWRLAERTLAFCKRKTSGRDDVAYS